MKDSFHKYDYDTNNGRPLPSTIIDRFMIIPREKVGILIGRKVRQEGVR